MDSIKFSSPAFTGRHIQVSKMSQAQKNLSDRLSDAISYCQEYVEADAKNLDVCFLPNKKGGVTVRILDAVSDNFVRENPHGRIVQVKTTMNTDRNTIIDNILEMLKDATSGKYKREPYNEYRVRKNVTDWARINPNAYGTKQDFDFLSDVMTKEDARVHIRDCDHHLKSSTLF